MDGRIFADVIEKELRKRGISKGEFYEAINVTPAAMTGWRNGATPKKETVSAVEQYFNMWFVDEEEPTIDPEVEEILEWIRSDYGHRALYESAKNLGTAESLTAAAFIEKMKSGGT